MRRRVGLFILTIALCAPWHSATLGADANLWMETGELAAAVDEHGFPQLGSMDRSACRLLVS